MWDSIKCSHSGELGGMMSCIGQHLSLKSVRQSNFRMAIDAFVPSGPVDHDRGPHPRILYCACALPKHAHFYGPEICLIEISYALERRVGPLAWCSGGLKRVCKY